ncbi:trimeric intracellular cation channel family protein [Congregibacter sp.]|uniref:trimeric intracellular cation channel family protein n=1 Tax=Congregibacter sp. TaxID=2744308 RepID=UPI003F6D30D5
MTLAGIIAYCDLVAVGVFAASGALAAAEKRQDILGFILFGTITGVGGGTLRDLLLQLPVFWISDVRYLWVCITVSALTWYIAPMLSLRRKLLLWADAMGLALFSVLGCAKALQYDAPWIVAVVMGVMSASFGGLIRDTLLGRESVLLGVEIYVTAALVGAGAYVALVSTALVSPGSALLIAMLAAFVLRAGAIQAGWRLPSYRRLGDGS